MIKYDSIKDFEDKSPLIVSNKEEQIIICATKFYRSVGNNCKLLLVGGFNTKIIDAFFKKAPYYPGALVTIGENTRQYLTLPNNFKVFYETKVPIGYGRDSQIHMYIINPYHTTYKHRMDVKLKDRESIGSKINFETFKAVDKKYKSSYFKYRAIKRLIEHAKIPEKK